MTTDQERLVAQAQGQWGDLVVEISRYEDGGLNVELIGGEIVTYWADGRWAVGSPLFQPSLWTKAAGRLGRLVRRESGVS